ncbi:MAG: glycoside hydrolase family 15 protein [Anaerolineales bacterium]
MPRDLPLGNGNLLVAFDEKYQLRELYWPHVGQENHAIGHPFHFGVWVGGPDGAEGRFRWLHDSGWERDLRYEHETMVTEVTLSHPVLELTLLCRDAVDFHEPILFRKIEIVNHAGSPRQVRLFFHHDLHILGNEVGDTTYYEPERRAVLHYKGARWFLINGAVSAQSHTDWPPTEDTAAGLVVGLHQWACGQKEIGGREGTWRDAENGRLSGNAIAQGSVDSTVGLGVTVTPGAPQSVYYWLIAGQNFHKVIGLNRMVRQRGTQTFLDRTRAYWRLWVDTHLPDLEDLPHAVCDQYQISLLVARTQIDNGGAILAANDTDISSTVRDTYSYMWPRDGALVARALARTGYIELSRAFFRFCARAITPEGYLLHKYNPDGTLASSWHPWYANGAKALPIQEDETALVLWALWEHFARFKDVEFIKTLYRDLITRAADFLADYREPESGLPLPSHDLWEERHGVLAWTTAATWAGLAAARNFAAAFGENDRAACYAQAMDEIRAGVEAHLWQPVAGRFARMLNRSDHGDWDVDLTIDASLAGLWQFGMYAPDDPKIVATMRAVEDRLWIKTDVGGVARYENDYYHQVSQDIQNVPGNPWFICTLWLAEWRAATARTRADLRRALDLLEWVADHALPSGVLAEQVHPYTNAPLSVSPLTWSHATFVSTVQAYLEAVQRLAA